MKIHEVIELCNIYGSNTKLGDLARKIQGEKVHKCPKCGGRGKFETKVNVAEYWECADRFETRVMQCDLCHGEGYTEHEYKPKMVQNGWE